MHAAPSHLLWEISDVGNVIAQSKVHLIGYKSKGVHLNIRKPQGKLVFM